MIENLSGDSSATPATNMVSSSGVQAVRNINDQFSEKYRLTMSNLLAASLSSGKEVDFTQVDGFVRKILSAKENADDFNDQF